MAQHKAPSQVTIAPLEEKSPLEEWVSRLWLPTAVLTALVIGVVLFLQHNRQKAQAARDGSWAVLAKGTTVAGFPGLPTAPPAEMARLADELDGTVAGPWARLLQATALLDEGHFAEATAAVERLRVDYPDHPLVTDPLPSAGEEPGRTAVDELLDTIDARERWEGQHEALFENALPDEGAPRVRLQTDQGDMVVALYTERAPKHAENFLSLCSSGYYDGTRFHRVADGSVQGGDPNSRGDDVSTWGQGGPETTLAPEETGLFHFEGVLSAAKAEGEVGSHGSQFLITIEPAHQLNGEHVIFGAVVEGLDVAKRIAQRPLEEGTPDRPLEPVVLLSTEVL